jgi:hypothetical protein
MCAGNQCCKDGSTCPSAQNNFKLCPKDKTYDCTNHTIPLPENFSCPSENNNNAVLGLILLVQEDVKIWDNGAMIFMPLSPTDAVEQTMEK